MERAESLHQRRKVIRFFLLRNNALKKYPNQPIHSVFYDSLWKGAKELNFYEFLFKNIISFKSTELKVLRSEEHLMDSIMSR